MIGIGQSSSRRSIAAGSGQALERTPDSRVPGSVGREARLELVFEVRRGVTVLAHGYAEPPFRIGRTFDLAGAAYLIIGCTGAGVFAGDLLRQSIRVGRGARVVLTSQAALQVHPPPPADSAESAVLDCRVDVEPEGELHCAWDPTIVFARARLDQRFDIRVADAARLYWSDALMAGRVSRGEVWQFEALAHELALRTRGELTYLERYAVRPRDRAVDRPWIAGAARYLGTTLVYAAAVCRETAERWQTSIADQSPRVDAAVDLTASGLLVARVSSADGAPFARFRASYRAAALEEIFQAPELAGRK